MTTLLILTFVIVISVGAQCRADQTTMTSTNQAWIQQLNDQIIHDRAVHRDEALKIIDNVKTAPLACRAGDIRYSEQQDNLTSSTSSIPNDDRYPRLLVFVSSSMPLATLKQLGTQLHRQGGKLVFRGLINNSFKQMAVFLQELGHEALIDSTLFAALDVQTVPTFVLFARVPVSVETLPSHDRLQGNVSLAYALERFGLQDETDVNKTSPAKIEVKP